MSVADLLQTVTFRARPHASGAIELSWEMPAGQESLRVQIIRRRHRYPASPAPRAPVDGGQDHLDDGYAIYDSAAFAANHALVSPVQWQDSEGVEITREYRVSGDPGDPDYQLVRKVVRTYRLSPTTNNAELVKTAFTYRDSDGREATAAQPTPLKPGEWYYYTAFLGPTNTFSRRSQAGAPVTTPYGLGKKLYELLPAAYQRHDTMLPDPTRAGKPDRYWGQLRRFIETVGGELDVIRTLAEGLRDLHDPDRIPADMLPLLASTIGWELSRFVDEEVQRREVGLAPQIFRTAGTVATTMALVNLYTGWKAEVRELSHRIMTTFDRRAVERHGGKRFYHGTMGRSLVLGGAMEPNLPTQVRNRPINDPNHYTYEMPRPTYTARYSMEAVGLWLYPSEDDQALVLRRGQQLLDALQRYLPAHVRVVLFIEMAVPQEAYDSLTRVGEALTDAVTDVAVEQYAGTGDQSNSNVTGWLVLHSNQGNHRTISISGNGPGASVANADRRTWHSALGRWM